MGIFDKPQSPQEDVRFTDLIESSANVKRGMEARVKVLFDKCWSLRGDKPEQMTDEEWQTHKETCMANDQKLLDKYGSDTVQLFQWHAKAQELLALDQKYKVLVPPYNITVNEDGTATLSLIEDVVEE